MEHVLPTNDKQHQAGKERMKLAAELAHDLAPENPPLVQTVLGGRSFIEVRNQLVDWLGEWEEIARETDTTFCIKPHRGGAVSQPKEAIWLWEQLRRPTNLRMVYDFSHYAFRGLTIADTVATALPMTSHVAVKDTVKLSGGKTRFDLPGKAGTIDFADIIRRLHAGGYRGDINCEVSGMVWNKTGYEPIEAAEACYRSVSESFNKAGVARRRK